MAKVFVITGTDIEATGKVSWKFMFDSGSDFDDYADISGKFGWLELKEKDGNYLDPFKLTKAWSLDNSEERIKLVEEAIGSDGVLRWNVNVFGAGGGLDVAIGVDDSPEGDGLKSLIQELPDCVLLMARGLFGRFRVVAEAIGVEVGVCHFDGVLSTS